VSVRTFLALDVDAAIRRRLAAIASELCIDGATVRPVARDNIHVTLNFLGEVADAALNDVCLAVADVAATVEPFEFVVRSVRCMPPRGRPRIVWADVDDPTGRLATLQKDLTGAMADLGFRPDHRRYQPHLTIARVKHVSAADALRAVADQYTETVFGTQAGGQVTTYTSELTPQGPIYTAAARAPLRT